MILVQPAGVTAPNSLLFCEQAGEWGRVLRAWQLPHGRFKLVAAQLPLDSAFALGVIAALGDDAVFKSVDS
jgi:hypothetical protein